MAPAKATRKGSPKRLTQMAPQKGSPEKLPQKASPNGYLKRLPQTHPQQALKLL